MRDDAPVEIRGVGSNVRARLAGALFAAIGIAALVVTAVTGRNPFMFVAVVFLLLSATMLAAPNRMKTTLQPFVGQRVRIEVWGQPHGELEIDSVRSFSAALLIFTKPDKTLLKVAQPRDATSTDGRFEIAYARYISYAGTKLPQDAAQPALVITATGTGPASPAS